MRRTSKMSSCGGLWATSRTGITSMSVRTRPPKPRPQYSSVTRRFYEAGWRGMNVEPVVTMFEKLVDRRPEDVNVQVACSDHAQDLTFYEVLDTGLSTVDPLHASEMRARGWNVVETPVHMVTLDSLLEEHDLGPIHFLKIDVEGAEPAVLAGCELTRWRPWVLVIEALLL